jgi:2-haloalkanoic acid dehalogenase type II
MTLATPGEEFDAYVFDAYGTLFDVSGPARRLADRLGGKAGEVSRTWRDKQIQYLLLRSLQGAFEPFDKVTADALDYALEAHEVSDEGDLRAKLLEEYRQIEAYPWAKMTLDALKQAGRKTVILSNGSPDMLQERDAIGGLFMVWWTRSSLWMRWASTSLIRASISWWSMSPGSRHTGRSLSRPMGGTRLARRISGSMWPG